MNEAKVVSRDLIVLCTFNEIDNLPKMVNELLNLYGEHCDILVVDDDSPDGTGRWAEEKSKSETRLKVIVRKQSPGLGASTKEALMFFGQSRYEYMVQLDADFSHPLHYIGEMIGLRDEGKVILGSRYVRGGSFGDYSLYRRCLSRVTNACFRLLIGVSAKDATQSFMMVHRKVLLSIGPEGLLSRGFPIFMELKYRYERMGVRIQEMPIVIKDREVGETKMRLKQGWEIFKLFYRLKISFRQSVKRQLA